MTPDALRARWRTRGADAPFYAEMTFEGDALLLGAGTALAKAASAACGGIDDGASCDDARLIALLSAAHRRPVAPRSIAHLRRAVAKRREGETTLALIHLALSGVAKLEQPVEDARRLFVADELMKAGVAPNDMVSAFVRFAGTLEELERAYDPNQPRVPPGNGRQSGQWTSGDWTDATPDSSDTESEPPPTKQRPIPEGVQIADNSANWFKYLNPVSEAEAASRANRTPFNGSGPNDQHDQGVLDAQAAYVARGFLIASNGPISVRIPGLGLRFYDFIALDPETRELIGVEVKTTQYDAISVDKDQVEKDVALLEAGGVYVPQLNGKITAVAYETFCNGCLYINLRKAYLVMRLLESGIRIRAFSYPGGGGPSL
jgi:hypothetical protein